MIQKSKILAPSLLAANMLKLGEEISAIERAGVQMLHLDIMDGHFVPNLSFGPHVLKSLIKGTSLPFDVHLMLEDADSFIKPFITEKTRYITVQQEACDHLYNTLKFIQGEGVKAGAAINPATGLHTLEHVLDIVDMVLIMTVEPGFGGQELITSMIPKIAALNELRAERGLEFLIEVDGGVNLNNAKALAEAGVDVFVAGASVFCSDDPEAWVRLFFESV
jgi:ribulose-phosphate 3-epimerase